LIKDKCDGENWCKLEASDDIFGDPCSEYEEYLEIIYTCVYNVEFPGQLNHFAMYYFKNWLISRT